MSTPPEPRAPDIDWQAMLDHSRQMVGWLRARYFLSSEDAEDVAAEALARAWARRDRLRHDGNLTAWLNVTANRVAIDMLRRRICRPPEVPMDGPALVIASDDSPAHQVERADETARVATVLSALPPKYSALMVETYGEGRSIPTVAQEHGLPEGTVKTRLRRGKQLFIERWVA